MTWPPNPLSSKNVTVWLTLAVPNLRQPSFCVPSLCVPRLRARGAETKNLLSAVCSQFKCFKSSDLGLRLFFLFFNRFPKSTTLDYFLMSAGICLELALGGVISPSIGLLRSLQFL